MSVLKKTLLLLQCPKPNIYVNPLKRFHSTDLVSNTISNVEGRLRLGEEKYCNIYSTPIKKPFDNVLKSISEETIKNFSKSFMMVSETQAKLLHQLVKLLQPKSILEIGGFTGYSAVAMASALSPTSKLDSLELDEQHAEIAVRHLKEAGLQDIVNVVVGPADESFDSLTSLSTLRRQYDMIFLDANKGAYIKYFDYIMENDLMSKNGVIIADNVLTFGQVHKEAGYDKDSVSIVSKNIKKTALKMHRFNEHVSKNPQVEVVILPIFDGLSIIRRKND